MNPNFDDLINLIKEVDGKRIHSPLSEYETIVDMKEYSKRKSLNTKQLSLMGRIRQKYQAKKRKMS